jgi:hypothetical protein
MTRSGAIRRLRAVLTAFIIGLVVSGVTALPLEHEIRFLNNWVGQIAFLKQTLIPDWIGQVNSGLIDTYSHYPWIAYGTDWLAFGHFAIAFFFIAAVCRPAQSRLILQAGIAACISVIPIALICGAIRGIPMWWRLIDSSFGIVGIIPLIYSLRLLSHIEKSSEPAG